MSYRQLTLEQRFQIYAYLKIGLAKTLIAALIGVHKSTISRELKRNTGQRGYRPQQAQEKTKARRLNAPKHVHFTDAVKEQVEFFLRQDWSPEQVSGYLAREEQIHISHETIYQHIWADKRAGGNLYQHLRWSQKKKRKRYGSRDRRGQIPDRVSIDQRPEIVNKKERLGDWEIDTLIGKNHQGALVSAVERKSQFIRLKYVPQRTAELVTQAIRELLLPLETKVLTITVDNGKEFAFHQTIAQVLQADVYFAHPYRAWERGLNEHINGLIRQYFPKNYDFTLITEQDILFVEHRVNNRPRKSLNFKPPSHIFLNSSVALGT